MTRAALDAFAAAALSAQQTMFGATVKFDGTSVTAVFTAPRMVQEMGESTLQTRRYVSTLRIPAASISGYITPSGLMAATIQLPDGAGWRSYEIMGARYVAHRLEWVIELRSL